MTFFIAQVSFASSLPERLSGVSVGGHRSGSRVIAETNLMDIKASIKHGVDILEMDLRLTKDKKVVVFHNENLLGKTICNKKVSESNYNKIRKCKLLTGQRILLFDEVLDFVAGKVVINAEFKVKEVIPYAIDLIRKYNAYEWVYFQNQADTMKYFTARNYDPNVYLHFSIKNHEQLEWFKHQNDPKLLVAELSLKLHTQEIINDLKNLGKKVSTNTWRVDRFSERFKAHCKRFIKTGFDIVTTNYVHSCVKQKKRFYSL